MSFLRSVKHVLRTLIPRPLLNGYHALITWLAMALAGFPSRHMVVIGVTGTDGKTSTSNYIAHILEAAGYKTGVTSTALIKVDARTRINPYKVTMLGRWHLAKLLRQMRQAHTDYAIIETSSEGLAQNRHLGIAYDVAVFTNLSPEHIEAHGSFEQYRAAKEKLFMRLSTTHRKPHVPKVMAVNLDDPEADHFLQYDADQKWGMTLGAGDDERVQHLIRPQAYQCSPRGIRFTIEQTDISMQLVGIFNLKNALLAATVARSQGVSLPIIKKALESLEPVPGRMEPINEGQPFSVIVDYAHAPSSLEMVYKTLRDQLATDTRVIAVLGAAGGGRDKAKRPALGKLAGTFAHVAIVTNEDPYDEDPRTIIDQVALGVRAAARPGGVDLFTVPDRRDGMRKALSLAKPGDIVIITGKGCEPVIMSKGGVRIPHDDRTVARELLAELGYGQKPKK